MQPAFIFPKITLFLFPFLLLKKQQMLLVLQSNLKANYLFSFFFLAYNKTFFMFNLTHLMCKACLLKMRSCKNETGWILSSYIWTKAIGINKKLIKLVISFFIFLLGKKFLNLNVEFYKSFSGKKLLGKNWFFIYTLTLLD